MLLPTRDGGDIEVGSRGWGRGLSVRCLSAMHRVWVQCAGFGYNGVVDEGWAYGVWVQCTGFGYNVQGFWYNVQGLGTMYRVWVQCIGCKVQCTGFLLQCTGFRYNV
jgi:hypothetical protein